MKKSKLRRMIKEELLKEDSLGNAYTLVKNQILNEGNGFDQVIGTTIKKVEQ